MGNPNRRIDRGPRFFLQFAVSSHIGLYRENAIAIESEARYPNGGNVYYVTMQSTVHIPEFGRKECNLHYDQKALEQD